MLFTEPIWLSILIPVFFALILLIASLVVRHWRRAGFDKAAFLSTGGLVLAFVTGGALFATVLVVFVLFTHRIAFKIESVIGCAPLFPTIRRWTVAIDAVTTSLLMMLFATVLFAWRCGGIVATPVFRWWRWSLMRVGRRGGSAL